MVSETHAALRRVAHPARARPSRTGRSGSRSSSRTTTRSSTRSACRARRATSTARSTARGNIFEGPRAREYPMPPLRGTGFTDMMADAARKLGWHPFPGTGRDQFAALSEPARRACITATAPAAGATSAPRARRRSPPFRRRSDQAPHGRHRGARHDDRGRRQRPRDRRHLSQGRHRSTSSRRTSCCWPATSTKTCACCCSRSRRRFPKGLSNNHGQVGRHYFSHNQSAPVTRALPARPEQLVRPAGAGRRRGQLGRRQLRSRGSRLHRRRQPVGLLRPPADRARPT